MKKETKIKWQEWLASELKDYDELHNLGKYQVMADLPPGDCFNETKKINDIAIQIKYLMESMLAFLKGELCEEEARKRSMYLKNTKEYTNASLEKKYIFDTFIEITK